VLSSTVLELMTTGVLSGGDRMSDTREKGETGAFISAS
jgi:hypothetical protein